MPLTLPTAFRTRSEAVALRPVIAVRLDIDQDPVTAWTGPGTLAPSGTGDSAFDGQVFASIGGAPLVSVSPVSDGPQGISDCAISLGTAGLNDEGLLQFLRDRRAYQGRKAYIWYGLLDHEYGSPSMVRYYGGVMKSMSVPRGAEGAVNLVIGRDTRMLKDQQRKLARHKDFFPTDTAVDALIATANGQTGASDTSASPPTYSGSLSGVNFSDIL